MRESLSLSAQRLFDAMDIDATYYDWNIQMTDASAFDELVKKGYLVKMTDRPAKYKFADDLIIEKDKEMYR
jgi:hypothetical protein